MSKRKTIDLDLAAAAIGPLTETYRLAGKAPPAVEFIDAGELPSPYRQLLAHDNDMTPTLETFHGESTILKVICRRRIEDTLLRQVVLVTEQTGRPVEFGAIRIFLDRFDPDSLRFIVDCRRPLGAIMSNRAIPHIDRPSAFFRLVADDCICDALGLSGTNELYGRCNRIETPDGRLLARVVEILPPIEKNGNGAT
jgi:chorismate-pyruvate lyase